MKRRHKYWEEMSGMKDDSINHEVYINNGPILDLEIPKDIKCEVFHPFKINGIMGDIISDKMRSDIINFIGVNDCMDSGNITEISIDTFNRFLSMPCFIGILYNGEKIIGTMFTIIIRAHIRKINEDIMTSYTTFLCIDKNYRNKGLAMILIKSIMKEGYERYKINHGYYMTTERHHNINNKLESWYRPINIEKAKSAGFTLESFSKENDRGKSIKLRQKLGYNIAKPKIIPRKVVEDDYDEIIPILQKGEIYMNPSMEEFGYICKFFDIYIVGDSIFGLFPMTSIISTTGKRIHNANLAFMIGDVISEALWIAKEKGYDILYGWCGGDINIKKVRKAKGLITIEETYLELYNNKDKIENDNFMLPIF